MVSEPVDLRVTNARVVAPGGTFFGGVAVDDGVIVRVGSTSRLPDAERDIDADGKYLIPGLIDPHVHIGRRGKGYPDQLEIEFESETKGAVFGGVTTIMNFIEQGDQYLPDVEFFKRVGEDNSYIDFTHHFVMTHDHHVDELEGLAAEGFRSFKMFFNMYKYMDIDIQPSEIDRVYRVLTKVAEMPYGLAMFHAENAELSYMKRQEVKASGRSGLKAWSDASPGTSEALQIDHICRLTEFTDSQSYIVHISCEEGVDALEPYQQRGVQVYGETLAPFLGLTNDEDLGVWGKVSPPIRDERSRMRLWAALRTGVIDHVGTDHISTSLEEKELGEGKHGAFWESPPGIQPGVESFLPVMLTEGVNKNRISMERLVEVCSTNNAKRFGLYPRKGVIAEGADADLVIIDLEQSVVVDDDFYHTLETSWSPFHGKEMTGLATTTIVDGQVIVEDGQFFGTPGTGSYLPVTDTGIAPRDSGST
ncbi:dihydroorotase family protein (plasmid) [Haloferax sp. S1W]|uniref:dihydroorotase family protein n=1 Tax=Haloferax sp. S1W TaxID=3377110 RepID=UPI0037CC9F9D